MKKLILSTLFTIFICPPTTYARTDAVYQKLKSFNTMRESLAAKIDPKKPITEKIFQQTCMPVGAAFKAWGAENGYSVRQISEKNRNPANAPNPTDQKVIDMFKNNPKLTEHTKADKISLQIYVRIPVVASCLHCHGAKDSRPDFIKKKYPKDLAYDFKVGDLRGLYFVSMVKVKK